MKKPKGMPKDTWINNSTKFMQDINAILPYYDKCTISHFVAENAENWDKIIDKDFEIITDFDDSHYDIKYKKQHWSLINNLSRTITNVLVSIIPMSAPTSKLLYMDFIFDNSQSSINQKKSNEKIDF